ncbi:hypothetical protein [Kitasatospora sp. NPDC088346]|uniref:hypothetical protein n=1 Tax=Kitasatospora sp. NPDC088346 TaxID=3364073 RepID=UPI00380011F6
MSKHVPMNPETGLPVGTVALFLGVFKARVALFEPQPGAMAWHCLGCGQVSQNHVFTAAARTEANDHAARCRSIELKPQLTAAV